MLQGTVSSATCIKGESTYYAAESHLSVLYYYLLYFCIIIIIIIMMHALTHMQHFNVVASREGDIFTTKLYLSTVLE